MALILKGSNGGSGKSKTVRTLAEKVQVIVLMAEGASAKEAMVEVFGETATPAMTKYPHSILHGFKKSIAKAIEEGDQAVIEPLMECGMIEDDEAVVED